MRAKFITRLAVGRIAYVREGRGPPILLLHGIPTSSLLWRNVTPHLTDEYEVYAPDLLGYGDSDKPENADLSVSAQADYLHEFMDANGVEGAVIVGHDIGGGVTQLIAVRHPKKIRKLVLIDSVAYDSWPVPEIDRLRDPAWDKIVESLDLTKGFRKAFLKGMRHQERVTEELVARYVGPFAGLEGRRAYLRCARALNNRDLLDASEQIERIRAPTLIAWGEKDEFQPLRYGEMLRDRLENARLAVVPDAGHFLPEDEPEELARLIKSFVKE